MSELLFDEQTSALPKLFEYDKQTRILEVEYTDGTRVRYFDVPPTVHFVLPHHLNPHRVSDFLQARSLYRSEKIRSGGIHAG